MAFARLTIPEPPRRGQPVQAAWGDQVVAALRALDERSRALEVTGGPGVEVSAGPGGQVVSVRPQGRALADHPFKVWYDSATGKAVVGRGLIGGFPVVMKAEQGFTVAEGISSIGVSISDWPHGWDKATFWCTLNSAMGSATSLGAGTSGVAGDECFYDATTWPTATVCIQVIPIATISTAAGGVVTVLTQFLRSDILYWPPSEMISTATGNELEMDSDGDFRLQVLPPP